MRAPRRVPWASRYELVELDAMLFAPSATLESRQAAVSRMAVYTSCPSCPVFVHLLHTLAAADLVDSAEGEARLACAMAVVRFVNGLVDPLQTGPYARPITHLAAHLGIPPHLIALRHRATHEDLPPLPQLRAAVSACLAYLHRHALLPLAYASDGAEADAAGAGPSTRRETRADGLVRAWKRAMKARVRGRDVDWGNETGREARRVLREIADVDADEAVEAVARALVPSSKKQRPSRSSTHPTTEALAIWTPLLSALPSPRVPALLADTLLSAATAPSLAADASARWTLLTWLVWLWDRACPVVLGDDERAAVWARVARQMGSGDPMVYAVLVDLEPAGPAGLDALVPRPAPADALDGLELDTEERDVDADVCAMEARLARLEERSRVDDGALPGWTRVAGPPTPIGLWVEA